MNVFVTGACGYKGSVLVPKLLRQGHQVVAFDIQWFGNFLERHPDLTVVKGDVRNPDEINLSGIDAIIHLSSVANDPCGDLDPKLTWEISCLATMQLADRAWRQHPVEVRQRAVAQLVRQWQGLDAQEHRLVLAPGARESLVAPRVPVHRVVRVLQQVGAGFARQAVGGAGGRGAGRLGHRAKVAPARRGAGSREIRRR